MLESFKGLLPHAWSEPPEQRVHVDAPDAATTLAQILYRYSYPLVVRACSLVLLCIGTDRSIGDALGPLIGTRLSEGGPKAYHVFGTLDNPVHAGNLGETIERVRANFERPFVLAVDACLGRSESVGMLVAGKGSLKPGAGVNKALPAVGDVYLTGIVNVGGFMEYYVLQNTRLSLVVHMAKVAATAADIALSHFGDRIGMQRAAQR